MLGIVAVGVVRERVPKIFRAPMYTRAHCAVIFAIAQLSCEGGALNVRCMTV